MEYEERVYDAIGVMDRRLSGVSAVGLRVEDVG
jgi:hypothetical protein